MIRNRAEIVDENFRRFLEARQAGRDGAAATRPLDEPLRDADPAIGLTGRVLWELFESQVTCRLLDIVAREMRARDEGFYTIGSAGHEGNVVLGRLVRHTDPSLLHYRSGALMVERARQLPGQDPIRDIAHSLAASVEDPIAGGRHKVFGSAPLWVPPQTSTIASHLPKAVGMAIALGKMKRQRLPLRVPRDSIILCSFGDASVNHAVAQTAFNSASWSAYQGVPVPILFVCEDNGLGISVRTPPGWVEMRMRRQPGFQYFRANGLDLVNAFEVAAQAVAHCRTRRAPTFLHLTTVRMLGHAGSDVETEYHSIDEIEAAEARDPLLASARLLLDQGYVTAAQIRELYDAVGKRVREAGAQAARAPKLSSAAEISAPLAPYTPDRVCTEAARAPDPAARAAAFGGDGALPEKRGPRHMAVLINQGLHDTLVKYPEAAVFGEDVAQKGGVYHVTTGLWKTFGAARVFNTLLDETSILGMAIGAAHLGMLPIPEIQYLAYYHNAEDQVRGEACSLQYFSKAQFANPMVVRIAGMAYQKGFGGHFHNDNSVAALRDIPGLVVALPARGDDAVKMFRTCMALAKMNGRVCAFIEPIALYMTKDLYDAGDRAWLFEYPPPGEFIPLGEGHVYHEDARDLTIVTYGNGLYLSLRAARELERRHAVRARVLDLRWLNPLNVDFICEHSAATGRLLVVDECRRTGGMAEPILASIAELNSPTAGGAPPGRRDGAVPRAPIRCARVCAEDVYIPLGPAANHVLPQEAGIVAAALELVSHRSAESPLAHAEPRARAASRQ